MSLMQAAYNDDIFSIKALAKSYFHDTAIRCFHAAQFLNGSCKNRFAAAFEAMPISIREVQN
jgi:hypothetical protein